MDYNNFDTKKHIFIKGAKTNNLKNIDVLIEKNKLTVITGVSGSGKSSLAFDTLFAEGQRRYIESLSSYARQFLEKMNKPDVDYIKGITPTIAIEQRIHSTNPRSTVGTVTEIYEYLKLLYARIGKTYSPVSGKRVVKYNVADVTDIILKYENSLIIIAADIIIPENKNLSTQLNLLSKQGYSRIWYNDNFIKIEDAIKIQTNFTTITLVIDRIKIKNNEETIARIAESVQTAFYEGKGKLKIIILNENQKTKDVLEFSSLFELDNIKFEEPTPELFSFNNPYGACPKCEGFGTVIGIDEDLVIPDKSLSVFEDAIACWKGEKLSKWKYDLIMNAHKRNFPIHRPICELTKEEYDILWNEEEAFEGINAFFKYVEANTYKIQYRILLARYRGKTICPMCKGTRLRAEASYVKINNKSITELVNLQLDELLEFIQNIKLEENEEKIAKRLITELKNRIGYMCDVGLGYLTLNRPSGSLSGGESQRMILARSIGTTLVDSTYILDEPTIGLHMRDTKRLINILKKLRDIGNTVVVVEHDEEVIKSADKIIDLGPGAGLNGGNIVFTGTLNELLSNENNLTAKYLSKTNLKEINTKPREWKRYIKIEGARENNLKNITVTIPLGILTVICGVSGSGKSTLVQNILYPALKKILEETSIKTGNFSKLSGDIQSILAVELVDQNPIGKSSRSNPVTYIKAFDDIRILFSQQPLAKNLRFKPGYFSFNVEGGRCEECQGEGYITVSMQFMSDLKLICESCQGKRYKKEALEVKYKGKNISEILEMTVDEAIIFFNNSHSEKNKEIEDKIREKLTSLQSVGLGYLKLGQPSSTLSGGEAQRIKLASFLVKGNTQKPILFIFDEPTTGLHFHDTKKLLQSFNALINYGHSVLVIEHNPEIIRNADWIIELGPEGGNNGGYVIFEGIPQNLLKSKSSITAKFI